jgi:hypothetical protein
MQMQKKSVPLLRHTPLGTQGELSHGLAMSQLSPSQPTLQAQVYPTLPVVAVHTPLELHGFCKQAFSASSAKKVHKNVTLRKQNKCLIQFITSNKCVVRENTGKHCTLLEPSFCAKIQMCLCDSYRNFFKLFENILKNWQRKLDWSGT